MIRKALRVFLIAGTILPQICHAQNNKDTYPSTKDAMNARAESLEIAPGADDSYDTEIRPATINPSLQIKDIEIEQEPQEQQRQSDQTQKAPVLLASYAKMGSTKMGAPEIPSDIAALMPKNITPGISETTLDTHNAPQDTQESCAQWIPEAESYYNIPQGILRSINLVESGGYPWTLNVGGQAYYASNINDALTKINDRSGHIRSDVAVGCMQLFTRYHSEKFSDTRHMIDPRTNVMYAAYYLAKLHAMYHSWQEAVARYHSPTEKYQRTYLCEVVNRRMRLGFQGVNNWYSNTCLTPNSPTMKTSAIAYNTMISPKIKNGY